MTSALLQDIRRWFDTYGTTLDDAQSFRIQGDIVRRELRDVVELKAEYSHYKLLDYVKEADAEIAFADALLADIDRRLAELLSRKEG